MTNEMDRDMDTGLGGTDRGVGPDGADLDRDLTGGDREKDWLLQQVRYV